MARREVGALCRCDFLTVWELNGPSQRKSPRSNAGELLRHDHLGDDRHNGAPPCRVTSIVKVRGGQIESAQPLRGRETNGPGERARLPPRRAT